MLRALGILRETQNSPNRESDDALILQETLAQARNLGIEGRLMTPEEFDRHDASGFDVVIAMCESYSRIMRLAELADAPSGVLWVNPPRAVLNCYRQKTVELLSGRAGVRFPPCEVRAVEDGPGRPPEGFAAPQGWWIKRGDVHNTCDRDVLPARSWPEVEGILKDFARREITRWVVQPHVPGDLVKFYGVGPGRWFTWFYHDPLRARRTPFDLDALSSSAAVGAAALDLEVFGGDAIIGEDGSVTVIDLNSWPSFALVRREAAVQISWHLQSRLKAAASRASEAALPRDIARSRAERKTP